MVAKQHDPGRQGECRRCGGCCDSNCEFIRWTAMRDIKAGEQVKFGTDQGAIFATCTLFYTDATGRGCTPEVRREFPYHASSVPKGCGFFWPEVKTDGG